MNYIDYLIRTCERFSQLSDLRQSNGARRIGRVRRSESSVLLADMHILNDGLLPGELDALEMIIKRPLPPALKDFFRRINGGHFFAGELSIYGLRRSYGWSIEEAAQPFAMEHSNVMPRLAGAPDDAVFFAFYMDDGSQLAAFPDRPEIVAVPQRKWDVRRTWPSLENVLVTEFDRLSTCFDDEGNKINPDAHCSPIATRD